MKKILVLVVGLMLAMISAFAENVSFYFPGVTYRGGYYQARVIFGSPSIGLYGGEYGECRLLFYKDGTTYEYAMDMHYEHWVEDEYEMYSVLTAYGDCMGFLRYYYYDCEAEFRTQSAYFGFDTEFGAGNKEEKNE